ncbi:sugar phosphate isomerase/epimerase family protein [Filimonas effusa]|uniref:Sugar phosphate isomerase/epimerase n=1 Tax=Filimonas effusa TaxID=2508721 RepID=A0A4Q1D971_9BACT|nr:sugar phosphate isomerase/epimerase family protein [Filimonas effusa]RXK85912.1 sugar phosphate isomerase/epimerase [Filimonas effusa]
MEKIKFGASLLSWTLPAWEASAGKYAIEQTAAYGFDVLEILLPPSMAIDTATVRQQLKQHRLQPVCSFNLPSYAHIPTHPKEALALMTAAVQKTAELEARLLGGVLHSAIGVFSGHPLTTAEEDIICEVWYQCSQYAQRYDITIAIEPINRYESYVCTCASDVLRMLQKVNASNMGLHLDTFHMNIEEAGFTTPVIAAGEKLKHLHITESDRGMPGEGNVHWEDFFKALSAIDYRGALVLENFSSSINGMAAAVSLWRASPYSAEALAKGSLAFMKEQAALYGLL